MEIGKVVYFFDQKKILSAVCLENKENKLHLLSEENREITLNSSRIAYLSKDTLDLHLLRDSLVTHLRNLGERQKKLMEAFTLRELWELVVGEARGFALRELTELVFHAPVSCDQEMALLRALFDDHLYFKQKGEVFEARDPEKMEQITIQLAREADQERELEEASVWLKGVWTGHPGPVFLRMEKVISLLKDLALYGAESPEFVRGKSLLQMAGIESPAAPFELLVRLGEWDEDENVFLHRYQISKDFPQKVLEETDQILTEAAKGIPLHPEDRDLTALPILTIDSETTRDIDDALSIERSAEGEYRVGIHITDVATFLQGHEEIFQEAMARAISIYLPDQRIPMIPPALSEGICSLIAGEKRRALSFLVRVDEEGRVQEYEIVPSVIQVKRRLSYDGVDQLLEEGEEELTALQKIAEKLLRRREERGAVFIPRPERVVRVSREKEIAIYKRERESLAQKMVSEFMILANCLTAQFLKTKGAAAIYRGQMEPREKVPPIQKFDPLQAYRLRRILNRVEISTQPMRHSGLGVEAYLTLTSPIRRFYDLLTEQQVLAVLRGGPIWGQPQLEEIITMVGPTLSKVGTVEESTERYWVLRYLEKRAGQTTIAVILDRFSNRYLIHLNEYLLEIDMPAVPGRDFVPGDQILVRVEKAKARLGILKVTPV